MSDDSQGTPILESMPAAGGETFAPRFFGQRVKRLEDPRFLMGDAHYVDDIVLPRMLFASFVRSTEPHARITAVDVSPVLETEGVVAALTGADIVDRALPIRSDSTMPTWQGSALLALAADKVRFVGEGVAVVAAEDRYLAEDAAELVEVDYEPLPPVASIEVAMQPGAAKVHDDWEDNFFVKRHFESDGFEDAFASAARHQQHTYRMARHSGIPMETRGCIAQWDKAERKLTLWTASQIPHLVRTGLADVLRLPEHRVRVIAPDVGGGFGIKGHLWPEEIACALLAMETGRPVKWIEDRREHMLASVHAREHTHEIEVAYDDDGIVHALRARIYVDCGAYSMYPWTSTMDTGMALGILPGPYRIRHYAVDAFSVSTNKCPLGPYRGVARPAACFSIERTMDAIADDLRLDRAEVRRRNLVRPEDFPYTSVTGLYYDSGSYVESLDLALEKAGYDDLRAEQARGREQGRYLGIGVTTYTEQTAHTTTEFMKRGIPMTFGFETATVRMDPSARVTVHASIHSHGQGLETTLAQIAADELGLPLANVRVSFGDTDEVIYGSGTFASRSAVLCGGATHLAAREMGSKLKRLVGHVLEAAPEDVVLESGLGFVRGSPSLSVDLVEVARWTYHNPQNLPAGETPILESTRTYDAPPGTGTFANSAMVALVDVDPETGFVEIKRLVVVEDCGRLINPLIVDGQVHGGVAQGIGSALLEAFVYDENGQMLTTTFMDYLLPGSTDVPLIEVHHLETPAPTTINGVKGMGEGGAIGPGAVITSAVEDALRPFTDAHFNELPLTPERLLHWLGRLDGSPATTG